MTEQVKVSIYGKLAMIQQEVKVPKSQYNDFGGYKYRSAEQIESIVKPICMKYGTALTLTDMLHYIGEWHYIVACATLTDIDTGEVIAVQAAAREQEAKKGMDASQITGTASSYARKYALSGLFLLDDVKDADDNAYQGKADNQAMWIKKLIEYDGELAKYEVDRHEQAVIDYVASKIPAVNITTLDPAIISENPEVAKAVIGVYKGIIAARKKKSAK